MHHMLDMLICKGGNKDIYIINIEAADDLVTNRSWFQLPHEANCGHRILKIDFDFALCFDGASFSMYSFLCLSGCDGAW